MRLLPLVLFFILPCAGFTQFAVSFHQSNLPFAGFSYEFKNRIRPELRLGTDNFVDVIAVEAVVLYDFINKDDYEFYGGLGVRANALEGVAIPIGLNIYPLPAKQFGFHIELAPLAVDDDILLRGSWGIRYRFRKKG